VTGADWLPGVQDDPGTTGWPRSDPSGGPIRGRSRIETTGSGAGRHTPARSLAGWAETLAAETMRPPQCASRRRRAASASRPARPDLRCRPSDPRRGWLAPTGRCGTSPAARSYPSPCAIARSTTSWSTWLRASCGPIGSRERPLRGRGALSWRPPTPVQRREAAYPRRGPGWRNGRRRRLKPAGPSGRGGSTPPPGTASCRPRLGTNVTNVVLRALDRIGQQITPCGAASRSRRG
jgi:hypothetical protein